MNPVEAGTLPFPAGLLAAPAGGVPDPEASHATTDGVRRQASPE